MSSTYIFAEILIGLMYFCLCLTYFSKYRKQILILNLMGHSMQTIAFLLLGGITGAAMDILACTRDLYIFANDEKKNKWKDVIALNIFFIFVLIVTIFTFSGWKSLFPVVGTVLFTISLWQKNKIVYKLLGIPNSMCWLGYNIFIGSKLGIIMESILLLSTIIGSFVDLVKVKKKRNILKEKISLKEENNKAK